MLVFEGFSGKVNVLGRLVFFSQLRGGGQGNAKFVKKRILHCSFHFFYCVCIMHMSYLLELC